MLLLCVLLEEPVAVFECAQFTSGELFSREKYALIKRYFPEQLAWLTTAMSTMYLLKFSPCCPTARLAPPMVHENHRADKAKERDAIPGIRGTAEDNAKARAEKDAKGRLARGLGRVKE